MATRDDFLVALREPGGISDQSLSDFYSDLYHEERRSVELAQEVSAQNIQAMKEEIAVLESAIEETKKNNQAHEKCIYGCSHLLGKFVIRKGFTASFALRHQRDKFKRLCELFDLKIESLRQKIAEKPSRIRSSKHLKDPYDIKAVHEYLDAEFCSPKKSRLPRSTKSIRNQRHLRCR
jgi:hypothetical protein